MHPMATQVAARICAALVLALPVCLPAQTNDTIRFSNWEFVLPELLEAGPRSDSSLTLNLSAAIPDSRGKITFNAGATAPDDIEAFLDQAWREASRGKSVATQYEPEDVGTLDGSLLGRRRSAALTGGGFLAVDAYLAHGAVNVMIIDTADELATDLTGVAALMVQNSIRLAPLGAAAPMAMTERPAQAAPVSKSSPPPMPEWVSPASSIRTSADLDELHVEDAYQSFIANNAELLGTAPARRVSNATAMATVARLIGVDKNAAYLAELAGHPAVQDKASLLNNATSHALLGQPAEALAALWIANERWPNDGDVLFNMASLLATKGFASESQAILDEVRAHGLAPAIGMGIGPTAAIDHVRGYNLMQMGDYREAIAVLTPVVEAEPYLAESSLTLALLMAKLDEDGKPMFLKGYYRRPVKRAAEKSESARAESAETSETTEAADDEVVEIEDGVVGLPAIQFVDISKGRPGRIGSSYMPANNDDAILFADRYADLSLKVTADFEAMDKRRKVLDQAWRSRTPAGPRLEYYEAVLRVWSEANARVPQMRRFIQDSDKQLQDLDETQDRVTEKFMPDLQDIIRQFQKKPAHAACPSILGLVESSHATIRADAQGVDQALRHQFSLWHQYATALGQMVEDTAFRSYLQAEIRFAREVYYQQLLANSIGAIPFVAYARDCKKLMADAALAPPTEDESALAPCDQKTKETRSYSLGPAKLTTSCEGPSLSLDADLKYLKLNLEAKFDRDGWLQERKIGASAGNDNASVSGEATFDKNNEFKEGKVRGELGGFNKVVGEAGYDNKGAVTVYTGTKEGGEVSVGLPGLPGAKAGASNESGSGYTTQNGQVTQTFTRTSTEASASVGGVGMGTKTETTISLPGPSVAPGSMPLPTFGG